MVSFFNEKEPLLPAFQYFGTQGFAQMCAGQLDPNALARAVAAAGSRKKPHPPCGAPPDMVGAERQTQPQKARLNPHQGSAVLRRNRGHAFALVPVIAEGD